jgi:hypothetical protein
MRWTETLYQRPLRRPIDEATRAAIHNEFLRRRNTIPVSIEFHWHPEKPQFTVSSKWLSFIVRFTHDCVTVDAEMSLTAKMFATKENRAQAVRIIDSIADDLGL